MQDSILTLIDQLATETQSEYEPSDSYSSFGSHVVLQADSVASRFRAVKLEQIQAIYDAINKESGELKEKKR